eukprot:1249801-Alexandrium_andersonii.AAC.1
MASSTCDWTGQLKKRWTSSSHSAPRALQVARSWSPASRRRASVQRPPARSRRMASPTLGSHRTSSFSVAS